MIPNNPIITNFDLQRNSSTHGIYQACGNKLGVISLSEAGYPAENDIRNDRSLRLTLQKWGNTMQLDSIMVLVGIPNKSQDKGYLYDMVVFEPNESESSGLPGSISTMCGNGIRAVAAYAKKRFPDITEININTMSGIRKTKIEGKLYVVDMGEFTSKASDLKKYLNIEKVVPNSNGYYINTPIPKEIFQILPSEILSPKWSIGLTGDRDKKNNIDGEPHIMLKINNEKIDIKFLREIAVKVGPAISKALRFFPKEINVNFIVEKGLNNKQYEVLNCTHERNLGNDANRSVTMACGTGSTVVGGFLLKKYSHVQEILVHCTGGDMIISRENREQNGLIMKGPAEEVI